jgi:GH18 family chitinase
VSYEDETSILAKGQYVRDQGLGGTIVWTIVWNINQGYLPDAAPGSRDPLMAALRQGFLD